MPPLLIKFDKEFPNNLNFGLVQEEMLKGFCGIVVVDLIDERESDVS